MPKISCRSVGALMCSGPSLQDGNSIPVAMVLPMALGGMLGVFDSSPLGASGLSRQSGENISVLLRPPGQLIITFPRAAGSVHS